MQSQTPQNNINFNSNTSSIEEPSSLTGLSLINVNSTIYIFSTIEESVTANSTSFACKMWTLDSTEIFSGVSPRPSQHTQNQNVKQPLLHDSIAILDDLTSKITVFTPTIDSTLNITSNTTNSINNNAFLSVFSFNGTQWTEVQGVNAPLTRREHSISYSQQSVYMFGGANGTSIQRDFWIYSLKNHKWSSLDLPSIIPARSGHTSTILSNGIMVLIGGYKAVMPEVDLIQMNILSAFDTKQSSWIDVPVVKGSIPQPRIYHSAIVLNKNDDIFICGGQNGAAAPFQSYIGEKNEELEQMTAILDTKTWTWRAPKSSILFQPFPQSHGFISFVNETKLIYGYGTNYYSTFDRFFVFDVGKETWESPPTTGSWERNFFDPVFNKNSDTGYHFDITSTTTILSIIIGVVGFAILSSYAVGLWMLGSKKLHYKISEVLKTLKNEIWKPRVGEPSWAEASRLALKVVFLFIFVYFIFILSNQVINSPVINQLSYESDSNMTVNVPDVRFCFDNWVESEAPVISCTTDFGIQCSKFCQPLDQPNKVCFIFKAPPSFTLGRTSKRLESSGSFLKFDYYYRNNSLLIDKGARNYQTQIDLTHSLKETKNETQSLFKKLMFNMEPDKAHTEQTFDNSYHLNTQVMSTISFELVKRVSLNDVVWNYIGIASSVHVSYELETKIASESRATEYNPLSGSPQPFGSLHILPLHYETKVLREQKAFAIINAVGVFGGLFGLLYSLQTCLFGYRPRSPWGYMHRWSFGQFRSSLINGLHRSFSPEMNNNIQLSSNPPTTIIKEDVPVDTNRTKPPPLVIPKKAAANYLLSPSPIVDYSSANSEMRLALIEERVSILEKLFQAYYIDDEIFRSLDQALGTNSMSHSSSFKSNLSTDSMIARRRSQE